MGSTRNVPTLGVEEEFLVVDRATGEPVPKGADVVARAAERFGVELDVELASPQVESRTEPCHDLADLRAQLHGLRSVVAASAHAEGCGALAVGAPPVGGPRIGLCDGARYTALSEDYRLLAREQSICGCHVHVAVPDAATAVQVCNHLRPWLAVLGALTANSPFADGLDTGYRSWRSVIWSRWPSAGPPPYFDSPAHYRATCDLLLAAGAARDVRMVYWDVRPSSHWPTVEVRIADVAATADEAVLLAGLVRAAVVTALADLRRGLVAPRVPTEVLRIASWRAARDGLEGELLDVVTGRLVPAPLLVDRFVHRVRDALRASGDVAAVDDLLGRLLSRGTGASRQREVFGRRGRIADVVDHLARETAAGVPVRTGART